MMTTKTAYLRLLGASALALAVAAPSLARADDYTDLLDLLRAKGQITRSEYNRLLAKHEHNMEAAAPASPDMQSAHDAMMQAQQSAAEAQKMMEQTQAMLNAPDIVHTKPYTPGGGITMSVGDVSINLSGFINGFYVFNAPSGGQPVAGGLSSGPSGFDTSSVRDGLLPAGFIAKLTTTQDGLDLSAVFGVYPGINNANVGALNANNGGEAVALGTPGIDFRQIFVTVGTKDMGTIKVGRDIGLFGADAILNDATLLSVGTANGNAAPGNTSLGRIGIGYIYTDWLPQITYSSPTVDGFSGSVGVMTPLDEFAFAGAGLSATNSSNSSPMFQGQLEYKPTIGDAKLHFWGDILVAPQDHLIGAGAPIQTQSTVTAVAGDVGGTLAYGPFGAALYYYRGSGVGTTALFFDGVAPSGKARTSEGGYAQVSYNVTPKLKLVGSYGESSLYLAQGETDPALVRRNESEIGAAYYALTPWMNLVGEYARTEDHSHGGASGDDSSVSLGTIVLF